MGAQQNEIFFSLKSSKKKFNKVKTRQTTTGIQMNLKNEKNINK